MYCHSSLNAFHASTASGERNFVTIEFVYDG